MKLYRTLVLVHLLFWTAVNYVSFLADHLHQLVFPDQQPVLQDDIAFIHTCGLVRDWFYNHNDELNHLT